MKQVSLKDEWMDVEGCLKKKKKGREQGGGCV